jgi:hypothetical protein
MQMTENGIKGLDLNRYRMSTTFWVYKPRDKDYFVAKPNSFGWYERTLDYNTGAFVLQLIQGVMMTAPTAWDWKVKEQGRTFAGLQEKVYDITELEFTYFPRL